MSISSRIIIIADSDHTLRNVVRQHLSDLGFNALLAASGPEAERLARRALARLVILDIELGLLGMYDACARIRRHPGYEGIPIVLLTAVDAPRRRAAAIRAGASAFLVKPFSVNDLMREIEPFILDPDMRRFDDDAPYRVRMPGFGEPPVQVWGPPPEMAWKFGTESKLAEGRRVLDVLRAPDQDEEKRRR
ncbi:MAG: response regulator [Acetobacteraceae bacterium]